MKLYTFEVHGERRYGAELKSQLVDLPIAYTALLTHAAARLAHCPRCR
jgi:hypothetical protein